jgi:hypothetical protein
MLNTCLVGHVGNGEYMCIVGKVEYICLVGNSEYMCLVGNVEYKCILFDYCKILLYMHIVSLQRQ